MGRHWAKRDDKLETFEDWVEKGLVWIRHNRQKTAIIAGGTAAAVALILIIFYSISAKKKQAWNELALAQGLAYSGRPDQALAEIKQLQDFAPGSAPASYGLVFAGDVRYQQGKYQEALKYYQRLLANDAPAALTPIALSDVAMSQEASGDCKSAVTTAQEFLNAHAEHFLAPEVHFCLARCLEKLGQTEDAQAAYQKIAIEYSGTTFAAMAQQKLKTNK